MEALTPEDSPMSLFPAFLTVTPFEARSATEYDFCLRIICPLQTNISSVPPRILTALVHPYVRWLMCARYDVHTPIPQNTRSGLDVALISYWFFDNFVYRLNMSKSLNLMYPDLSESLTFPYTPDEPLYSATNIPSQRHCTSTEKFILQKLKETDMSISGSKGVEGFSDGRLICVYLAFSVATEP